MKIYQYSVKKGTIVINEIEAEEKDKTYKLLTRGNSYRSIIKKKQIGEVLDSWWLDMYLTERDDERYKKELINMQTKIVASARSRLEYEESRLEIFKNIKTIKIEE